VIAYQDKFVTLYQGDAMEITRGLGLFDCCITDPPYEETSKAWDKWPADWPLEVLGHTASLWCFGSLRMFMDRRNDFIGWKLSQDVVWEKHNGSSMARDRFRRVHEVAAHFYSGEWSHVYKNPVRVQIAERRRQGVIARGTVPEHWHGVKRGKSDYVYDGTRQMRSVIYSRSCHGHAIHPTQKPEAIIEPLIEYSVPPGGSVLDLFAGSATTLVVARRMGRKAVGIEADPAMVEKAVARLSAKPIEAVA
jgi:site-specific DNA-methyltransferase (adenine-specific)